MSAPRRERDNRRQAKFQDSEDYFRRMMEETPSGRVTPADVAHISKHHARQVNERRPAEAMGMTRGGPQISFGSRVVSTPRKDRKE